MTDAELIEQYHLGSRSAFEQLVHRHVNWVHSIAQRRVRDAHLAEDATQATFIVLARKAPRLKAGQALSTWLFPVVNFASRQVLRAEHRRRLREVAAAKMNQQLHVTEPDRWDELSPMLDDLVGKLGRADRQAVLLRFYEQKSFPEIGQIMQISEEAARKRVSRAVEHLRESFTRRGIAVGSTTLGTVLVANATQPASAAVVASASASNGSAALGPIIKGINSMLVWTSVKPLAVIVAGMLVSAILAVVVAQLAAPQNRPPIAVAPATAPATLPADVHFGVVVTRQGKPVPDARVWLVNVKGDSIADVVGTLQSDAQGKFQVTKDSKIARSPAAVVLAPGYALSAGGLNGSSEHDPGEVELRTPGRLRLRLVNLEGKPVAGVTVAPLDIYDPPSNVVDILPREIQDQLARTTDADGVCTLDQLPRGAEVALEVRDIRFAHPRYTGRTKLSNSELTDVGAIKLQPGSSISGKVAYEDSGKPFVGLGIDVFPTSAGSGNQGHVETDGNGVYRIDQLSPNDYCVRPSSRQVLGPYAIVSYRKVTVGTAEQVTGKDMPLVRGGTLRGKVTVQATGEPVANSTLMIFGPADRSDREWNIATYTNENGEYSVIVPPGSQSILPRFAAIARPDLQSPGIRSTQVEVAVEQTVTTDFQLQPKPGPRASGKVVDPQGRPLAGVFITAENKAPRDPRVRNDTVYATTDEQGRFTLFGVNDGDLLHAQKRPRWMTPEPLVISDANRSAVTITMHKAQWASVLVKAQREDTHLPVAGGKVRVYSNEDPNFPRLVSENLITSEDGSCEIEQLFPDIKYTIQVWGPGLSMGTIENLSLSAGNRAEPPPVALIKADSLISGMLLNPDSQPVADIEVVMSGKRSAPQTVRTDVTGHFTFKNVTAGDTLSVYATRNSFRTRTQEVPAGTDSIVITFRAPAGM